MASASNKVNRSLPVEQQWLLAAYHGDVPLLKELLASGKVNAATTASEDNYEASPYIVRATCCR